MVLLIYIGAVPFLIWLWLGITFTIIDYTLHYILLKTGVTAMDVLNSVKDAHSQADRAPNRLIRYTKLDDPKYPHMLSRYTESKNLIEIDIELSRLLPDVDRNYLEMSCIKRTRISGSYSTLAFVEYDLVTHEVTSQ